MSFDFQLGHACPHLTIEEEVPLGSDRMELRTRQPVASSSKVKITANDEIVIPPTGFQISASITGASSGPFNILKNENSVTLSNRESSLDILLPVGSRVETRRVVDTLNAALRNASVSIVVANDDGVLQISDFLDQGPRSQVRIGGEAAGALGFSMQVRARGRTTYPSWGFAEYSVVQPVPGLASVRHISARYPKFTSPVLGNPVFKVSYTTYQDHCRRCQSFGIENDYRIAASGEPLTVVNEDLLNQAALKILSTVRGSNPFHPEYGTLLLTRIGTKALGAGVSVINEDVITTLARFKNLQGAQASLQEVSPRERLATVISVNTTPSVFDPSVFEVDIVVANASNIPVVITTVYAAPGTAALAGSNGLSLGLQGFGLDPRTRALPGVAVSSTNTSR
jgi:phage baseplate assembly protein W